MSQHGDRLLLKLEALPFPPHGMSVVSFRRGLSQSWGWTPWAGSPGLTSSRQEHSGELELTVPAPQNAWQISESSASHWLAPR